MNNSRVQKVQNYVQGRGNTAEVSLHLYLRKIVELMPYVYLERTAD